MCRKRPFTTHAGKARVSTADGSQSLDLRRDALQAVAVDAGHVSHDCASGVRDDRPGRDSYVRALRSGRSRHRLIGDSGRSGRLGVPQRRPAVRGRARVPGGQGSPASAGPGPAVADLARVDDQGRAVGRVGELVAQPRDVGAHDLGIGVGAPGPDPAQPGLAGQDPAGVLGQHAQERVRGRRPLHRAPGPGDPPLVVVEGEGPARERDGRRPPAPDRPDRRRERGRRTGRDDVVVGAGLERPREGLVAPAAPGPPPRDVSAPAQTGGGARPRPSAGRIVARGAYR